VILALLLGGSLAGLVLPLVGAPVRKSDPTARTGNNRPGDQQAEQQKDNPVPRQVGTVFVRVVDSTTKEPLPAVNLKVWTNGKVTREHTTDDSGRLEIRLPADDSESMWITARRDGLIPIRVYLRAITARETEIPRSYTLAMEPGTSIGGIVRDEAGQPIEGVNVNLYENRQDEGARQVYDFGAITARSDRQGRWQIDLIPDGFDLGRLHFTFSHPEFLSATDAVNTQSIATPKELREKSAVLVLHPGIAVNGRILDRGGRPIAGATVRVGEYQPNSSTISTDAFGRFHIGNALPHETVVTAQAAGYAPEMQPVKVEPGLAPVELRLGPGNTIRGRVVDREGHPIQGAIVGPLRWRGHQTLEWRVETDALGRFRWDDAPSDAVSMSANKRGYSHSSVEITPSTKEYVLTLSHALLIRGSVTDAQTGRPIGTFTVIPSVQMNGNMTVWMPGFAKTHHGGRFEFPLDSLGTQPHRVRIEAEDYRAAVSPTYASDAGEQVFDARLEKGEWIKGVVRGRDGRLVAGAEVIIAAFPGIHISGGKTYQRDFHPHMLTGADGRFGFAPIDGPFRVIALHDVGYAEAAGPQLAESHELKLEPWGRIEGTLRVGGKPLAHETVVASLDEERIDLPGIKLQNESRAQTDEQGRFVIERIVPGEASVYWQPTGGERKTPDRYYQPAFRTIRPAQTVQVDLIQDGGRPLEGKVVASDRPRDPLDLAGSNAYLLPKAPEVPYPPGLSEEDRREWLSRWRLTEEGREYRHARRGFAHGLGLNLDGTFRVDEVQPGAYQLHVRVKGFVELVRDFEVAEPPPGQNVTPVDLGTLALKRL
jgi:Carboxypeptidase regulatory-like domain